MVMVRDGKPMTAEEEAEYNVILEGDILDVDLPKDEIDLIVTSPPYNVKVQYANGNGDAISKSDYGDFSFAWLDKCYRACKSGARLCLNVALDTNKVSRHPIYAELVGKAQAAGWNYFATIVWNEGNISRRTAWGSWMSASAPCVIAPVEMIVLFSKGDWKRKDKGESDITKEDFIAWTNGLWTFNGESKKRVGHPAPFPVELPKRCIKLFSYKGDLVFDPFAGSGTTGVAALAAERRFLGVEVSSEYAALARKRIYWGVTFAAKFSRGEW